MTRRNPFRLVRRQGRRAAVLAIAALGLSGCTDAAGYDLDYLLGGLPHLGGMRTTVAYTPNTLPLLPAAGSVPVASPSGERIPPFTQAELESVASGLTNPIPATPEVLARGQIVYRNQCFVCHGVQGEGNGPVVGGGRFPLGPTLVGGAALTRTDGYLYGVIRVGRGLMPTYGERISENDRWAVVNYVRELQRQAGGGSVATGL